VECAELALAKGKSSRTRRRILDAAEVEFAAHGFDGVSMRQIADGAAQALGVVTYHFTSKEALFEEVVVRRAQEINSLRHAALEALDAPTLEQVIVAFLGPFLDRIENGGAGWTAYAQLLAHISHQARWADLLSQLFGETVRRFIRAMRDAEPGLSLENAKHGYVQLVAVMVGLFASTRLIDRLSPSEPPCGLIKHYEASIRFVAHGIRGLNYGPDI
jgi:AcrR family transcriptional regulator